MKRRLVSLLLLAFVVVFSSVMCSTGETPKPEFDEDMAATLVAMKLTQTAIADAPEATPTPEAPPSTVTSQPPTPAPTPVNPLQFGSISGSLSFPSEGIPALHVVAFDANSQAYYSVATAANQSVYRFENLPAGFYYIVAYTQDGAFSGGYTQAVPCGLAVNCSDHSLIPVEVKAGQESTDINPGDWYAPAGAFPPNPLAPPPAPGSISGQLSYPSEFIPPLRVVAFNIQTGQFYYVDTVNNQGAYTITNLPAGIYHVVAYMQGNNYGGGYTHAVPCGLSVACTDHNLIDIHLNPGDNLTGINPGDWYAPDGTFPPNPAP